MNSQFLVQKNSFSSTETQKSFWTGIKQNRMNSGLKLNGSYILEMKWNLYPENDKDPIAENEIYSYVRKNNNLEN